MKQTFKRGMSFVLVFIMVVGVFATIPFTAFATSIDYTDGDDDYYKLISKKDWELAPGIVESEIILNNDAGSHRQVSHVVEVDLSNPYTKVIPSTYKMAEGLANKDYKVQIMSQQAAFAEANGYGNVVAAMNISLSWYDSAYYLAHPELEGEPLGYLVLDGELYVNSQGQTSGAQTCVVINFDEKDGEARPADMPKVEIRSTSSAITGWEEQVIPANFGFLVKDGKNQYTKNHTSDPASRSFVGIKADGTFVMVMNDGRQAPYSTGFNSYEMAEFMLSLGCVAAVNGDGGGSSAFLSQRPGEELKVNCSPSDGAERPTTHGILVISTAPATGEFVKATITAENDYYTPGSTVEFSALGTDLVGTPAEIPADVTWQLADPSMGTIENGVFVSNGKVGTATAQMVWNGAVVGSASVEIVIPTEFAFSQGVMTVPFDKEVNVGLKATINGGLIDVVLKPSDVILSTNNDKLGTFDGFMFTSVSEENAPENLSSTVTATLVHDTSLVATASLSLGKGSEVLFDFEDPSDIDAWNIADVNGNDNGFYQNLSYANAANGEVHDGVGSMRVEMNPIAAPGISKGGYAQSDLFLDNGMIVENAKAIGFWAYIPDEYEHCWIRVLYWIDSNGDGKFETKNTVTVINQPEVYNTWNESGWKYFSVDVSKYSAVLIPGLDCQDKIAYNATKNDANNFRFIEFMFPHTNTNDLWKTYGTINGLQTVYIDNITADFSDAVDDREEPKFSRVELAANDNGIALEKYKTVTTASNLLTVTATVAENTAKANATGLNTASAKAYVDGVEVPVTFANGRMTISDVAVADGIHRVKFEICDNMGNKAVVIRLINVDSGVDASTVQLVPADPTLNNLYGGSIYWMNMNANKIETIKSVKAVVDLNYGNHFELANMVLAEGFTAEYTIDEENNTATIVITRTGVNTQTGAATLAALPVRVIYFDTDIKVVGYDAETYWNTYEFWPYDLKVDVDMGEITYVDGYASDVLGAFSNEEFSVDTELQAAFSDEVFKAERRTAHVHSAIALADKAATCTEAGYTGRTYCAVCDSVVDWGTIIKATGHSYEVVNGVLTCACGELFNGELDGVTYIDGVIADGWINDTYYYVDGVKVTGDYVIDKVVYCFDDNGVYQPNKPFSGFIDTTEGLMYFTTNTIYLTGYQSLVNLPYYFDANGIAYEGEFVIDGEVCTFVDGKFVSCENPAVIVAGWGGENITYVAYDNGDFVLNGSGDAYYYYNRSQVPWQSYRQGFRKIIIGKDITSVGRFAFTHAYYITEIVFEEGSKLEVVDYEAFYYNKEVKTITLPETVKTIGWRAFGNWQKLQTIYLPDGVTSIHADSFWNANANAVLKVAEGTYAHTYAVSKNRVVELRERTPILLDGGACGENLTWALYDTGVLYINGNGAMPDYDYPKYSANAAPWALSRDKITKVVIGAGVENIGTYAFYQCTKLAEIEFAADAALTAINEGAFGYIDALKSVTLPASLKTIGKNAFYFSGLETVVMSADAALESIGDTAFRNCTALTSVYLPDGVKSIGYQIFRLAGDQVVVNVAANSYANRYAKNNGYAFVAREALPVVKYSGTCGEGLTWALYDNGILYIDGNGAMPDYAFNKNDVTAAPWAAYRSQIVKVVVGAGVENIGAYAFYQCTNLAVVEFAADAALTSINEGAFGYTSALKHVVLPASLKTIAKNGFYFSGLESVAFAEGNMLTTLGDTVFRNCTSLTSVYLPDSVKSIGYQLFRLSGDQVVVSVASGSYAHRYAKTNGYAVVTRAPQPVVLYEGACGEGLTWALYDNGILYINGNGAMPAYTYNKNDVTAAPWAQYRSQILKVVVGAGVENIGAYAFYQCTKLTEVEFVAGALTTIGEGAFGYTTALKNVVLPASLKTIGLNAFYFSGLETVAFAENSNLEKIEGTAFRNCTSLVSVYLPASVSSIGYEIFRQCGSQVVVSVAKDSYAHRYMKNNNYAVTTR